MKILYVPLEFSKWQSAQYWSYPEGLGLEEGFKACGVECFTLPALIRQPFFSTESWLDHARRICANIRFDSVWLTIPHIEYDSNFLEWLTEIAPTRIGYFVESIGPYLGDRPIRNGRKVQSIFPYLTHALVWDEMDVAYFNARDIPALWCPVHVPERFVNSRRKTPCFPVALFFGAMYGERIRYLKHPTLSGLLVRPPHSLEHETQNPQIFDALNDEMLCLLAARSRWNPKLNFQRIKRWLRQFMRQPFKARNEIPKNLPLQLETCAGQNEQSLLIAYLERLRECRHKNFELWLDTLVQGLAIVNLPQGGFGYSPRVVEAMAVGRPVLAHRIPNRPRTVGLFKSDREIFLYDCPEELAGQIRRLQQNSALCDHM
ncbi:MAG: glycosyltransferase, partial [Verrucomicrobiota bacterium]